MNAAIRRPANGTITAWLVTARTVMIRLTSPNTLHLIVQGRRFGIYLDYRILAARHDDSPALALQHVGAMPTLRLFGGHPLSTARASSSLWAIGRM